MPAIKDKILPIELTIVDSSTLTGTYVLQKTITEPLAIFKVVNNSDELVQISWNGNTDHDAVREGDSFILNCAANDEGNEHRSLIAQGTTIFMKGTAGTGNIYLIGYYHPTGRP